MWNFTNFFHRSSQKKAQTDGSDSNQGTQPSAEATPGAVPLGEMATGTETLTTTATGVKKLDLLR